MSVESYSITLFVLDISAPMGSKREVEDTIVSESLHVEKRKRTTTDLEWVIDFVSTRIAEIILRGLKTTRVAILTYGSPRTNNAINDSGIADEYQGIDEIFRPAVPTLETLDLVQSLRAVSEQDQVPPGDPLAALVDAIQLSSLPARGGIKDSQKTTWKRTIYLVTDGRSSFSWDGADAIRDKLNSENINLRLLGIDFDDIEGGLKLDNKSAVKQNNEKFWHKFLSQIPSAGFATAASAIEQASMPNLQVTKPAPSKTVLSFGNPQDLTEKHAFQIPIALYKMTDIARPMTQSKISKLAKDSADAIKELQITENRRRNLEPSSTPVIAKPEDDQADDLQNSIIYRADIKRDFFLLDELSAVESANKQPKPLPADSEANFTRAWKLGASLIPVPDEAFGQMQTHKSMEILHFFDASTYRREYNMDQIWYVFADHAQVKAQLQLSAFVKAMVEMDVLAVVRLVKKDEAEPELGILKPKVEEHNEYFFYSKAPFREDLRRFLFPPLDRKITTEGIELWQGPTIPTEADQKVMDDFVDSMELDEDWFDVLDSFNPAVYGLKAAVRHRFIHPDDRSLPGPHPELVKYLDTPYDVKVKAAAAAQACRERFKIAYVPPRGNADRRKRNLSAMQEDLSAKMDHGSGAHKSARAAQQPVASKHEEDDDVTEDEDATSSHAEVALVKTKSSQSDSNAVQLGTFNTSKPVEQFLQLIEKDDITKAMAQLENTIKHLIETRQYEKAADCMKAGKKVAQEYEEAMRWNIFVRSIKPDLLENHKRFWQGTVKGHYELGLVTEKEDEAGQSDVTAEDAREFIETEEV